MSCPFRLGLMCLLALVSCGDRADVSNGDLDAAAGGSGGPGGMLWFYDTLEDATVVIDAGVLAPSSSDSDMPQGRRASLNSQFRPTAGGLQALEWDWNVSDNESTIIRRDTVKDTIIATWFVEGRVADVRPSPRDPDLAIFDWRATSSVDEPYDYIVDLTTGRYLRQTLSRGYLNWMPDGSLLRLDASGETFVESVDGQRSVAATTLALPRGLLPSYFEPSHDGRQLAVVLVDADSVTAERDVWLADAATGVLERYTKTKISSLVIWSPDDAYIAFDTDTGFLCNGFGCLGECASWYAPRSGRNITALGGSDDSASSFGWYRGPSRGERLVKCSLLGWTTSCD